MICVGFTHHQSKTPTLASEQRNAHPPQSPMSAVFPKKMARLSASVASGLGKPLATVWSQKKRSSPPSADRRTSRNGRSEKNKPQTPGVNLSGRKYRKQSEASIRPRRGL